MAKTPGASALAELRTQYVALTALSYWSAGQLRKVEPSQGKDSIVDDIPAAAVDNWLAITPPAIRIATEDDLKGAQ